jgi:tetratricopeptide (TPR) repeat protein
VPGYSDPLSRLALIQRLSSLPAPQLDQIIFALNPPKGNLPAVSAAPTLRVNALLEWVENSDIGCGWAVLEQVVDELLPREAEVATPQGWLLAHPYGMPPHFTGRKAELQMLSDWLGSNQPPLLVLRALGGFGKSALTWHWLTQQVSQAEWPLVVWWSFYEASASFENFLRVTLSYLSPERSRRATAPRASGFSVEKISPRQQLATLLQILQQRRVLLVMDGFERELRAYSGMGAAYQGDEEIPPPPPTLIPLTKYTSESIGERANAFEAPQPPILGGPEAGSPPELGDLGGQPGRDCISPYAEEFLRQIASLPNLKGKVLMSTRLRPRPVELHGGVLLQGCREQELTQLQPEDAVAFFRKQGIQGSRAEIQQACSHYGYHPLSLRLLAGYVLQDFQFPGDIRAAASLDLTGSLIQRRNHVLARSYENLSVQGKALLGRIACFRSPVTYGVLDAIGPTGESENGREQGSAMVLPDALRDLLSRGLLHQDLWITRQGQRLMRFDLHPIVRRYGYERMADSARTAAHSQLRDYFAAVPEVEKVTTLEDLAPVIELYHHMVRAEQYDEAFVLFRDRLASLLYYQLGAYQVRIELLRSLFPQGETQPPGLKDERAQGWTLNSLANSYSLNGQPAQAVPLFEQGAAIDERRGDKENWAIALGNLAQQQLPIGALAAAETNLRRQVALCQELEDEFNEAISHQGLGRLLTCRGVWTEAEAALNRALELFEQQSSIQSQGIVWAYRALLALHQHRSGATPALTAATRALELADETAQDDRYVYPVRDYVRAHWLLGAAHRVNGNLSQSDTHLSDALSRCRAINLVEFEADILLDLARLRADQQQADAALRLADSALSITERSGYVLQGADVRLFLAQQALARGDTTEARIQAQAAQRLAHCDGGDHTYQVAYAEAGDLLQQLTR